jgi:hypothetical protein
MTSDAAIEHVFDLVMGEVPYNNNGVSLIV